MMPMRSFLFLFLVLAAATGFATTAAADDPAADDAAERFRTDENQDQNLPWYQPVKGEFPPEGSAHAIKGELIWADHVERELHLRVDRDDSQGAGVKDLPLLLTMLPYGSIQYNGQPAALQDIPLGTHLHTWCYPIAPDDDRPPLARWHDRISPESEFRQCIRIEDDFSYHTRRNQVWRVDDVDRESMKLTATLRVDGQSDGDAKQFDLLESTVVYRGNGFGTLSDIHAGQEVQMNLTWATLYGPGRVFHIWLDQESRDLAGDRQRRRHRDHIRQRGIPGWVDAVDDQASTVTVTFFDGLDMSLLESFHEIVPEPLGWPTSGGAKDDLKPKGTLAVARWSLMTYEPLNDRKGGNILKIDRVPVVQGCCGVQIQLQCGLLLEGYRPGEIVRFFPASWPFVALPAEERFFGRE
ncbi:hypothetical protein Mal15_63470 [Stieleria maiorica]|uniref:Uncharacterized protein n=1 Tax=Stieleria maiorica TaxID=2795974 RepID=A0A5B9MQ07_9BACT|nr:hypothetical protein [Stieleria maiorica]QEG02261.1 hypothetical protein Mal15_63470 [Stieleria maiorica]